MSMDTGIIPGIFPAYTVAVAHRTTLHNKYYMFKVTYTPYITLITTGYVFPYFVRAGVPFLGDVTPPPGKQT